jgi:phosphatidylserine decarboxylase
MTVATYAAAQLLRVLPRARITRAVGRLCDAKLPGALSTAVVNLYVRAYRVELEDAERTEGPYTSFDAFFTRSLRPGARPICPEPDAIVSPADGRIDCMGTIRAGGRLEVKGRDYALADLVGDATEAARYDGGQFAIVYLSPRDYHRVHSPVTGLLSMVRSMPGDLYPVNAIGERHVPELLARNRRVALVLDTKAHGRVTLVMVAAMIVGRITVTGIDRRDVPYGTHVLSPPPSLVRGDEIGIFHLGSTAVIFVEKGAAAPWGRGVGPVRMGERLDGTRLDGECRVGGTDDATGANGGRTRT